MSLKYRIAIIIFLLEAVMVSLVLWQTQSASFQTIHRQTERSERTILDLMAYEARYALINGEYADFQVFAEKIISNSGVLNVILADYTNRIVVSTNRETLGKILTEMRNGPGNEWHSYDIANESGDLGRLLIDFSREELIKAYAKGIKRGITTATVSMGIIALVGIMIGFLLTMRLENLQEATQRMAAGDLRVNVSTQGRDELATLGRNFNTMAAKLRHEMETLDSRVSERTKDLNSANRNLAEEVNKHKETISKLEIALAEVKTLRGILPICSHCKKIRDDKGYWNQIESYLEKHSAASLSHSICKECAKKYYPDYDIYEE